MGAIKKIFSNQIREAIIIFIIGFVCMSYLETIYPPASFPFIIIYYIMWFRFMWSRKDRKEKKKTELDKLMELCEKPKGRWDY